MDLNKCVALAVAMSEKHTGDRLAWIRYKTGLPENVCEAALERYLQRNAKFEQWYVENTLNYESNPLGSAECGRQRAAYHAALEEAFVAPVSGDGYFGVWFHRQKKELHYGSGKAAWEYQDSRYADEIGVYRREITRLNALIDRPFTDEWFEGVKLEAAHQIDKHGATTPQGKEPTAWLWLTGYLVSKAVVAAVAGDVEKAKHHTISAGAVLLNWFRHLNGTPTIRPGIVMPDDAPLEDAYE